MCEDRRSDERKRAEQMYLESGGKRKLVDIAAALQLPDLKIRKWKSLDKWDSKLTIHNSPPERERSTGKPKGKKVERSTKKKQVSIALRVNGQKKKTGAPKGNKNAVGNKGNPDPRKNALKHGVYADPFWGCLMDGEESIIEQTPTELEDLYREQIQMFRVREFRIMSRIKELKQGHEIIIESVQKSEQKRSFESEEDELEYKEAIRNKVEAGTRLPGDQYSIVTNTRSVDDVLQRWEKELSTVQRSRADVEAKLAALLLEKDKISGGSDEDLMQIYLAGLRKARGEDENQS